MRDPTLRINEALNQFVSPLRAVRCALWRKLVSKSHGAHISKVGFTLLELVIAITILALVFTSLYGAYSSTLDTSEQVENERDVEQVARLALVQMGDDFKGLFHKEVEEELETSPYRFVGGGTASVGEDAPIAEFVTTSHLAFDAVFPSLQISRVSYVLEKQTDDERYHRLVRRQASFSDLEGERVEEEIELADGVEELTLTYYDDEGRAESEWDSDSAEREGRFPRLIQMELTMAAGEPGKNKRYALSVAPMVRNEVSKR